MEDLAAALCRSILARSAAELIVDDVEPDVKVALALDKLQTGED